MADATITILLNMLDQAFDHKSWHGTNLKGSLRGMTAKQAAWRPGPERHIVWEIVVHAAYWKYIVRRWLLGEAKGSFPLRGSNWIRRPAGKEDEASWKSDVLLLMSLHKSLREAVAALSTGDLAYRPVGSKVNNLELVTGIVAHDLYHAGQIQLLKRLRPR